MAAWRAALPPGGIVLAAVSGGADSVFLLHELIAAGCTVCVAHANHGQRGEESDADQRFVEGLCARLGVACCAERMDVPPGATEAELRRVRLAFLKRTARAMGAAAIALGHNLDDAAETFLMAALRGASPSGLGAMRDVSDWRGGFVAIRPLLGMRRAAIRASLEARGIAWREDSSNAAMAHLRNRLRAEVMPALDAMPGGIANLAEAAARAADLADWIADACDHRLARCGVLSGAAYAGATAEIAAIAPAQRRVMLRHLLHRLGSAGEGEYIRPHADFIRRVDAWFGSGRTPAEFACKEWRALCWRHFVVVHSAALPFAEALHAVRAAFPFAIAPPGMPPDGLAHGTLRLRRIAPSDVVALPNGGHAKARDILQGQHIPAAVRPHVLGAYDGDRLVEAPAPGSAEHQLGASSVPPDFGNSSGSIHETPTPYKPARAGDARGVVPSESRDLDIAQAGETGNDAPKLVHRGWYSRGYLPHCDFPGALQAITYRLADSLPRAVLNRLSAELAAQPIAIQDLHKRRRLDELLDAGHGSCLLLRSDAARLVVDTWHHFAPSRYDLIAWVVMPNHVHVMVRVREGWSLGQIVQSWKSYAGSRLAALAEPSAATRPVWQREYWDRYIRDEQHYSSVIAYIHRNPVKARLVARAEDWPWSSASGRH